MAGVQRMAWWASACAVVQVAAIVAQAHAATFVVDTIADGPDRSAGDGRCVTAAGACTLRAAVQEANATPEGDVVVLSAGTYALTVPGDWDDRAAAGDLDVHEALDVQGAGLGMTILDAGSRSRVFHVQENGALALSGLTLAGGMAADEPGGAVLADGLGFSARDCAFIGSRSSASGSAIAATSALVLDGCVVESSSGSVAVDTGASSAGASVIRRCTFRGNSDGALSGAALIVGGCTFEENEPGGAIDAGSGDLLVRGSTFRANRSEVGGSITMANGAFVTIEDSTFADGAAAWGGAIGGTACAGVRLTLRRVRIHGCSAGSGGGAIFVRDNFRGGLASSLRIVESLLDANVATESGGAVLFDGAAPASTLAIVDSTLSGNTALRGSAIAFGEQSDDELVIAGSTLVPGEGAGVSAIDLLGARSNARVTGSIVLGASVAANCDGGIVSEGHNLFAEIASCAWESPTDRHAFDPRLGPLEDNGGPTPTHALLPGSPAIDAAGECVDDEGVPLLLDQRGQPRPLDGDGDSVAACDIGAVEGLVAACGADTDGDTTGDACDCARLDSSAMRVPEQVDLRVTRDAATGDAVVTWSDPRPAAGSGTTCDVASETIGALRRRRQVDGPCLVRGVDGPWIDSRAVLDVGWYYVVRAVNACGPPAGMGWGRDSFGQELRPCW